MAYETEEIKRAALKAIEKHNLIWIQEAIAYLPCNSATFYNHKLHEDEDIKDQLFKNRIRQKVYLRQKWYESDNITAQVMLYKLTSDEEELRRLSVTKSEVTGEGGKTLDIAVTVLGNDKPILDEPNE
jgi:23S rRNA G2069 N7-methylase RlmK/C1962 C5-methylase RlmI